MIGRRVKAPSLLPLLTILAHGGFVLATGPVAAPFLASDFGLDDRLLARLFAWLSLGAVGTLGLARFADRLGRRRMLLVCMSTAPIASLGAAAAEPLWLFALLQAALYSLAGASVAVAIVLLAESNPVADRARAQASGGVAMGVGGGACLLLMPVLEGAGGSWRGLLVAGGAGLLLIPWLARRLPESHRWRRAATAGGPPRHDVLAVFSGSARRHSLPLLASALLSTLMLAAAMTWRYFHSVSEVGLSPAASSALLIAASGLGLAGFPLGAWACDAVGRVPTVAGSALLATAASLFVYWGPPDGFSLSLVWLALGFTLLATAANAMTVGGNCSVTELLPPALRATLLGWLHLAGVVSQVAAQTLVATLAVPLGGISRSVGLLTLSGLGVATIFLLFVAESRGRRQPEEEEQRSARRVPDQ